MIGPNADSRRALVGNYEGTASRYITVLEIEDYVGDDVRVLYSEGCHLYKDRTSNLAQENDRMSEVLGVCKESDVVVAVLGLDAGIEGEEGDAGNEYGSGDKPDLNLPGLQEEILEAAVSCGKPVILVLLSGSALAVNWADEHVDAIVQGWYPGQEAELPLRIFYLGSKPGRKTAGHILPYHGRTAGFRGLFHAGKNLPVYGTGSIVSVWLWAFLHRVCISKCEIFRAGTSGVRRSDDRSVCKNTGKMDGTETVQVYVKAEHSKMPHGQLKRS